MHRVLRICVPLAVILHNAGVALGQSSPARPIRIVTSEPGSGIDIASRLVARGLTSSVGQPVIVDNRGGTVIATAQIVTRAAPDGHTLLLYGSSLWLAPLMRERVPYDTLVDFSPITLVASTPNILVVHPTVAAKNVKDLIALAKARPGALNYASGASGGAAHLAAELFRALAGVDMVQVAYKGTASAISDLVGGQVQLMFCLAGVAAPHVKSGRVRPLAVTSAQPSVLLPDLPTVAASGVPGYESVQLSGVFAPAHMPAALVTSLNQQIVRALERGETRDKLLNMGMEATASSPAQFSAAIKAEVTRMGKVIKDAGIRAD